MSSSVFSQSWYRVADLQPRLCSHVHLHRHHFRGQPWYVLQDEVTGQYHRFSHEAYQIIGLLNGQHSLQQVWNTASENLGDDMPSQDEIISLVSRLHRANALQSSLPPDVEEQVKRGRDFRRKRFLQQLKSPLGVRIPLWDPDRFLSRTLPLARHLFSLPFALFWLLVVVSAAIQVPAHWHALTGNLADRVFATENLAWLWLTYPLVKAIHELAHGYAVKRWGGQVHDMGVMLLVFVPVPYVDASAATAFAGKWQRALVGAAGILAEVFIAAIALHIWLNVEAGAVRAVAFNSMLIAGISTLLFNGNPLLRFDAYYVLADLIEIPNLAQRGNQYVGYLIKRYGFGVTEATSPVTGPNERLWLFGYSVASFVYRMLIMVTIILFVAGEFFMLGVVLAVWSALGVLLLPLFQTLKRTMNDKQIRPHRIRAISVSAGAIVLLVGLIGFLPLPLSTSVEGVVTSSEDSFVRAGASGVVDGIEAVDGSRVSAGQVLVRLRDPELSARVGVLRAQIVEAEARAQASQSNHAELSIVQEELRYLRRGLDRAQERRDALLIRAPVDGRLLLPAGNDLVGQHLHQGQQIGRVVNTGAMIVRAVVNPDDIDLVRAHSHAIEARFASLPGQTFPARLLSQVPAATRQLPSPVLSIEGGGNIALDPGADAPLQSYQTHFNLELAVENAPWDYVEERVYVLFRHPPEPLAQRWYRSLRQLLLERFDI